jgi:hypothetical protein
VHHTVLEAGVEAEVVRFGEELDVELLADGHAELALEVVADGDLDDVRVTAVARETPLEDDRCEDRRRLLRPGGDPEEHELPFELRHADLAGPPLGHHGELDDLLDEIAVPRDGSLGVVDVGGVAQPVVGRGGAPSERDATDGQRTDEPGQHADQHQRAPAGAHLGSRDGDDRGDR